MVRPPPVVTRYPDVRTGSPREPPLGVTLGEASRLEAVCAEHCDCFVGVHAVGPAAVATYSFSRRIRRAGRRYVRHRYGLRAGDMSGRVSCSGRTSRTTIRHCHPARQLVGCDRFEVVAIAEESRTTRSTSARCCSAAWRRASTSCQFRVRPAGSARTGPRAGEHGLCLRSRWRWRDASAIERPVSDASDSTVRSPWASTSRISRR